MKNLSMLLCLLLCISVHAEGDKFIDALRNCSSYSESGNLIVNGIDTKINKLMIGWQNDKCVYKETVSFGQNQISTVCKFSKPQINEIISVADAYFLTLKYSNENIDTSSVDTIKNNPVGQVLSKYLQDSSVCSMEGL